MTLSNSFANAQAAAPQYVASLLEVLGGRDPLAVLSATPAILRTWVDEIPSGVLTRPEAEGKWSIAEVIQHVADTEVVYGWRLRMILGSSGSPIQGFDQDAWARNLRWDRITPDESLAQFTPLRAANLSLVRRFTRDELEERYGMHSERGRESAWRTLELGAAHDLVHRRQIERIRAAFP